MDPQDYIYRRAKLQLIRFSNLDSDANQEADSKAVLSKPPPKKNARPIFQSKKDKIFKVAHKLTDAIIPLPKISQSLQVQSYKLPLRKARLARLPERALNIPKAKRWKSVSRERLGLGGIRGLYMRKALCESFS